MHLTINMAFLGISPGAPEMIFVFVMILLLFGSKNVPKIARSLGRTLEDFRRAARDVSDEVMRADADIREDLDVSNFFEDEEPDQDEAYYDGRDDDFLGTAESGEDPFADDGLDAAPADEPSPSTAEEGPVPRGEEEADEILSETESDTTHEETVERKPADG